MSDSRGLTPLRPHHFCIVNLRCDVACEQAHLGARTKATRIWGTHESYTRAAKPRHVSGEALSLRSPLACAPRYIRACPNVSLLAG